MISPISRYTYFHFLRRPIHYSPQPTGFWCSVFRDASLPPCILFNGHQDGQRRSFFKLFRSKKRELQKAEIDPGVEKMMELAKMQRLQARLPPRDEISTALIRFIRSKVQTTKQIGDTQAALVLQSLKYCMSIQDATEKIHIEKSAVDTHDLLLACKMLRASGTATETHVQLAALLFDVLKTKGGNLASNALWSYCAVLASVGRPQRARELLTDYEVSLVQADGVASTKRATQGSRRKSNITTNQLSSTADHMMEAWLVVLKGFASRSDEAEIFSSISTMRAGGHVVGEPVDRILLRFYMDNDDLERVRQIWFEFTHKHGKQAAYRSVQVDEILQWCAKRGHIDFGHDMVRVLLDPNPPKYIWDLVLVWATATGKGVDEIGRMFDVMEQSIVSKAKDESPRRPDIATINGLVDFAISRNDPYSAERLIALGKERNIEPDGRTFVLQMGYRLDVSDVDGALIAYKNLQAHDFSSDHDILVINKLIVGLCHSGRHDFDTIMNVAADLSDRQAHFEPTTVSSLCLLHLRRNELHDVLDLLNTHVFKYSSQEKEIVRDNIVEYCLDATTNTSQAWGCYNVLRQIFDELPRASRTRLMENFLQRKRSDMAVHVFNHMRAHSRRDVIPTSDTYVSAFIGIARLGDLESLEVVHNQLKLDFSVDVTTRVRNALIMGYALCDRPRKALQFWDEIAASKEGPNYDSIHIALRACELSPFGDMKAQEIWTRLRRSHVEFDQALWASYLAATAGNGNAERAMSLLDQAVEDGEVEVDACMIGSVFNAVNNAAKQDEIEAWAKRRHAGLWFELKKFGMEEDANHDSKRFKIERTLAF